jgi:hypothetical protein
MERFKFLTRIVKTLTLSQIQVTTIVIEGHHYDKWGHEYKVPIIW